MLLPFLLLAWISISGICLSGLQLVIRSKHSVAVTAMVYLLIWRLEWLAQLYNHRGIFNALHPTS